MFLMNFIISFKCLYNLEITLTPVELELIEILHYIKNCRYIIVLFLLVNE